MQPQISEQAQEH